MISLRSWFDFTRPPPYSPIGEPPSDEKYFQDTAKYWFGNIEALNKFTSLRKPSDMAASETSKSISLVDSRPTTPLNDDDVEQEPLMPRQTVHQPPTASDDGRGPEESGLTFFVDLIGFARVLCFILAAVALICFSVMGPRLSWVISDWTGAYIVYWIAMGWSFITAISKLFRLNVSKTHVRIAINNRECSLGGGSSTARGRLFRKFCMSVVDLAVGIPVIAFTADAAVNMNQCYNNHWSCKDTHFNRAVVALGSALGAIMVLVAFLEPFPVIVSKYISIRMTLGTVRRKNVEDGDIYLP